MIILRCTVSKTSKFEDVILLGCDDLSLGVLFPSFVGSSAFILGLSKSFFDCLTLKREH